MSGSADLPAILGGIPIRPGGPPTWPGDWADVQEAVEQCLRDGSWGRYHASNCEALTSALSEFHAVSEVMLCSSGTAAIELALRAAKVEPGDEVVMAAYDFKANFQNILMLGATPVLVDLDPLSWQIDVDQIEAGITDKTRAIIVSHLHGAYVSIERVLKIAESRGLTVIEDACQATGAILESRRAGTTGHIGVLSFGGSKLLTSGRGGAVLTNNPELAQRIRLYTKRGNEAYPLSELQAAALVPQLTKLDSRNRIRCESVRALTQLLRESDAGLQPLLDLASLAAGDCPAFYKVGLQYDASKCAGLNRDRYCEAVRAEGVALDPGFRSLHRIHSKRRFRAIGTLDTADAADEGIVVLHHPLLLEGPESAQQFVDAAMRIQASAESLLSTE